MSNIDKAARFIAGAWPGGQGLNRARSSRRLAERMEEAGLLAPELPAPDSPKDHDFTEWHTPRNSIVWTVPGDRLVVQRVAPGDFTPDEAREIGLAFLAAAECAEGK